MASTIIFFCQDQCKIFLLKHNCLKYKDEKLSSYFLKDSGTESNRETQCGINFCMNLSERLIFLHSSFTMSDIVVPETSQVQWFRGSVMLRLKRSLKHSEIS